MKPVTRLSLLLITVFILSGCSFFKHKEDETARQLYEKAMKQFGKKNYTESIKLFEQMKNWYPFSDYATQAELKIAEAHFNQESYDEAIIAFNEFEKLHPSNGKVPYVIYKIGLCYFLRLNTIDRDQTPAKRAIDAFNILNRQFPENEFKKEAEANILECKERLVSHEIYIASFYLKSKHYKAALQRFRDILAEYPEVDTQKKEISEYIFQCEQAINSSQE